MKVSRRKIQIALGILWLLAGLFQLQPKMFTSGFVTNVIKPAQAGQPFYIHGPIQFGINVFLTHPAVFNSLIAIIQVGIGLMILYRPFTKYGLWLSVLWGLFVWSFGEGFAGMVIGQSSIIVGLPGAALLYSLLSLGVLPKKDDKKSTADSWLAYIWAAMWVVGAIFNLLPAQSSLSGTKAMIISGAAGAPGWLYHANVASANYLDHFGANSGSMSSMMSDSSGYLSILIFSGIMMAIGLGVLINKPVRQTVIVLGILLSLFFWVVGQNLGGFYTGFMTDVGTSPLIILLGVAVFGQPDISKRLKQSYLRLEKVLS